MPLFQQSVLKKFISDLNKTQLQNAWQLFQNHFFNPVIQQNIRNSKEEEYQEGFVRDLFVNVLGYTLNPQPDYNFVLEKKTVTDATKSDGAILLNLTPGPSPKERGESQVIGVVELKDTGTPDLDKISNQAFGYKHKHKNCIYVVTSNFEKLRFYINDATDYEEFELFTLTEERFAVLFLCLHQQNILANIPLQIKQQSLVQEENVTKKLYADYSLFKRKLFQNIAAQNTQYDKLLLFKKTQKLLDRFLFIFFAEDRLLLPPNSVREILKQWEQLKELDNYVALYERFKKYFGYLNVGHVGKQHEIFAYNGGLFLPDEILDALIIDDTILYDGTKTLSGYDFETDVDVNILGHIFEHSLTEIEELQLELEGKAIEKNKTKRKKEGVFYTPRYITKYIVENTVGALCTQKKEALQINEETFAPQKRKANKKILLNKIETYRNWLLQLTICDPACGSGAFLNAALEYLKAEHRTADELTARIFGDAIVYTDLDNSILEHNLFGVDINEDAIEIAKLSLWLHTAKKGRKLSNLSNNIKCGNSLIDDATVAGDKAFNWKEEFKNVFSPSLWGGTTKQSPDGSTGFDVVIGNPPYVRAESILPSKVFLEKNYKVYNGNADLYVYFIEKGITLLKVDGIFSFISPNKWIQSNYGMELRNFLISYDIQEIVDFGELKIFVDAGTFPSILIIKKSNPSNEINYTEVSSLIDAQNLSNLNNKLIILQNELSQETWLLKSSAILNILKKLESHYSTMGEYFNSFFAGIKTGANKLFIYTKEEVNEITKGSLTEKNTLFRKILFGQDFKKYSIVNQDLKYLFFPYEYLDGKNNLLNLENFPNTFNYLNQFYNEFAKRAIIKDNLINNRSKWYELQQINRYFNYSTPKIIYPDIAIDNRFIYDEAGLIPDMTCFFLTTTDKHLLPILNSKMFKFLASNYCPILGNINDGGRIRYKSTYLAKIPFPICIEKNEYLSKADIMLSQNKELNQLSQQFINLLQTKFTTININNKLQCWYSLTANDFFKELAKQKIKLPLSEQQEWLQYFEQQKINANNIQQTIQQTDAAIDAMVYQLYGLTEEEITIVEGK